MSPAVRSRTVRSRTESATSRPSRITCTNRASRDRPLDQLHLLHVGRRLLAPARLALLLGVGGVEGPHRRARLDLGQRPQPAEHLLVGEAEVAPLARRLHRLEGALRGRVGLAGSLDQVGHEVGLGRDRQLRVGVEHHPQQRRAGAVHADDERHRLAARVVPLQLRKQSHGQWLRVLGVARDAAEAVRAALRHAPARPASSTAPTRRAGSSSRAGSRSRSRGRRAGTRPPPRTRRSRTRSSRSSTPPPGRPAAAWWSGRERRRARPPRARDGPSSPPAPRPSPAGARSARS